MKLNLPQIFYVYSINDTLTVTVINWNSTIINGSWRGETAGGCHDYPTFTDNPQYVIELQEDADGDGKCSVLIAMMQKIRKQQRRMGVQDLHIGYAIYKVTCYGCNMGRSGLPDMFAQARGQQTRGKCIHIKANHNCTCYICYVCNTFSNTTGSLCKARI